MFTACTSSVSIQEYYSWYCSTLACMINLLISQRIYYIKLQTSFDGGDIHQESWSWVGSRGRDCSDCGFIIVMKKQTLVGCATVDLLWDLLCVSIRVYVPPSRDQLIYFLFIPERLTMTMMIMMMMMTMMAHIKASHKLPVYS